MAELKKILIPDIGDFKDVPVIEVLVQVGDTVNVEDSLVTLESEKATIEIPSPHAGVIKEILIKAGDKVSEGSAIMAIEAAMNATNKDSRADANTAQEKSKDQPIKIAASDNNQSSSAQLEQPVKPAELIQKTESSGELKSTLKAHASPSVRRFARELGVNLELITGSGPKQRIVKEDVQAFVKAALSKSQNPNNTGAGLNLLPWPQVDFAKFGPVEPQPLSRIKQIAGANLHRNWVMIPHVTQFDEADITDLEEMRKEFNESDKKNKVKLTFLAFLMKALIAPLKKFPHFNASLDNSVEGNVGLIIKHYYHIGFAVDTPNGLVVPVIKQVDQKGIIAIADELSQLATLAREGKLKPTDMQGASFTISSLGGIGGTAFTPIINAPEVAILGVSKARIQPVYRDQQFVPRLMLPLSLSYDHRVIDGAAAARFTTHLAEVLTDMRLALL
ncbi:MAG TPA: dihydrolipoyllysine-residue acetyltransferase [Nitrosomonas sp.]|nr:dihydrolipoyllysine-residue acetyltransferase [Nitrosomonas sp.]HQX14013.1 dihydrolipoyllysine-residue acetyltransferase [Nitrosomonas sp.]HRB20160.1 dihydrolipoyllysine-residue acetyltransferase [Nitrosomonas sp.]HRB33153.1 dihydrolipoyllysine-residue acetyltransferase [Nitrosomonas sp.]HRB46147.1 dihydrolipoyllysine-residue acetyltransferase [Nitrosomonas sp.]